MNKKTASKLVMLLLASIMLITACSGNNQPQETPQTGTEDQQEEVNLTLWYRWPEPQAIMQETIDAFEAEYPHIQVELVSTPPDQWAAQVQTAIAGNELPDMFPGGGALQLANLHQLDILHDLDEIITPEMRDRFYEGTWMEGYTTMDDKIYAFPNLPSRRFSTMMFYNLDVLEQAGLTEADVPKSWDELENVCRTIVAADNQCLIMGLKTHWLMERAVKSMASAISPEVFPNTSINYKTGQYEHHAPGIVQTLDFLKNMQDEKLLHPNSLVIDTNEASSLFAGGRAAFLVEGSYKTAILQNDFDFDRFGSAPLPTKDGLPQYWGFQGETPAPIHVNKNTPHFEEVKLFLQFVIDNYYPKLLETGTDGSPIVEQNENFQSDNTQFVQAMQIQNDQFILSPSPFQRNLATIEVTAEMGAKLPKNNLGTFLEGYLAGQVSNMPEMLERLSGEYNELLQASIDVVAGGGNQVQASDYVFENWTPLEPYTTDKYDELGTN
ncbi:ABC transporter substrate-binding protein [Paenibacillus sp. 1P07SE]|uniref:ABC transporter substrate-binding protein n=1 Tax=Paenibacillus sp. 1P07SE TaxID=3132209 RepID=UPI0039A48612